MTDWTSRINLVAEHYHAAHSALSRLDPHGSWKERLKELKQKDLRSAHQNEFDVEDIRPPKKDTKRVFYAQSKHTYSWIWLVPKSSINDREETETSEEELGKGKLDLEFNYLIS